MTLRVGIDVSPLVNGTTGVARYADGLVEALRERDDVVVTTFAAGRGVVLANDAVDRRIPVPLRLLHPAWRWIGRPRAEDLVGPVDVVHAIDIVPPPSAAPLVVTCHDVLPITHPDLYDIRYRKLSARHVASFGRAAAVITTCEATAAEIVRVTGTPADKIHVAPPGPRLAIDPARRRPATEPFLLYVGAITPRKRLHHLVAALSRLTHPPRLVVAGPNGMRAPEVHAALARYRGQVPVELLGRVDDAELTELLETATLLCHPSEAEGFGIPVLEAMAAGLPVVASDIPPTRELGGGAVTLVPVDDEAAWADAIEVMLADRARLVAAAVDGARVASTYTWDDMARRVVEVYRQVT